MTKEQYAAMLADISETHKKGGDTSACIAKYKARYKYIYVYNDIIFKILFGNPENEKLTVDFLNAILNLCGSDRIDNLTFVNPSLPDAFSKNITSDVVAKDQRFERIVLEVQHVEDETYSDRLVFYTAKHTVASLVRGENYLLRKLNLISLQMFTGYPESRNYWHSVRLKNQDNETFFEKQTITLVEIPKFLKNDDGRDSSMIAQWLRVIDGLNNESPVPVPKDSQLALLQEKAKLSIFTDDFLVSEAMNMSDRQYELYVEKKHARAEGLAEGRAEGRAEGLAAGQLEGRAAGLVEGAKEKAREIAKGLRDDGVSLDIIARCSGLSKEEILAL